jgi:hypothetical protein
VNVEATSANMSSGTDKSHRGKRRQKRKKRAKGGQNHNEVQASVITPIIEAGQK